MKKTINVNIGGTAFTLEEDAYEAMGKYLDTLRIHFDSNDEAAEILADIEARINELLNLKLTHTSKTVSLSDVHEIIKLVGSPSDLGYEPQREDHLSNDTSKKNATEQQRKKRLYRDSEGGILAGVCAGIGHYFSMHPPLVRLIWILACLLPYSISSSFDSGFSFPFLLFFPLSAWFFTVFLIPYIILWLVIPKAKTLEQKLEMTASSNEGTLQNIENRSYAPPVAPRGEKLGKILKTIGKVIAAFIGIDALIALLAVTIFFLFFLFQPNLFGINNYLTIIGITTGYSFLIPIYLCCALPLLGICYIATKIVFSYRFRSRDWILSGIATTLWIATWIYLIGQGLSYHNNYRASGAKITEPIVFSSPSDTLYIDIDSTYEAELQINANMHFFAFQNNNGILGFELPTVYFLDSDSITSQTSAFIFPQIHIVEDNTSSTFQIDVERMAFGKTAKIAQQKANNMQLSYQLTDSRLVIKPPRYSAQNPWQQETYTIRIRHPLHKVVVFQGDCMRNAIIMNLTSHYDTSPYIYENTDDYPDPDEVN